jgi:hypothetical protein
LTKEEKKEGLESLASLSGMESAAGRLTAGGVLV